MKVVVLGGCGFIGSFIADHLAAEGNDVVLFDVQRPVHALPRNVRYVEGDTRYQREIEAALGWDTDEVYDVAGILGTAELNDVPQRAVEINILGCVNMLEACKARKVERIFHPSKPLGWANAYTETKEAAEKIALRYASMYGMSIAVTRWMNAYGPRQHLYPIRKMLPLFVVQALRNLPLTVYGDGSQTVDMVWVGDIARIAVLATRQCGRLGKVLDVGTGFDVPVLTMAEKIIAMTGSRSEILHLPMRAGEPEGSIIRADTAPLRELIEYGELMPLDEGLAFSIEYYASLPNEEVDRALAHFTRAA